MNWSVVFDNLDLFAQGLLMTLQLSGIAALIALIGGLLVALLRLSHIAILRWIAAAFINVLRSVPPFALIIYVYYGISLAIGVNFTPFFAGVLALALQYTAWMAEVYRAGIQAVPPGQIEAAHSLGFNSVRTFISITLPQALRIVIPPLGNNIVGLIKDSSLVSYIGVMELIRSAQLLTSQTFRPFEIYTATVILYLVVTLVISQVFSYLERRHATGRDALGGRRHTSRRRRARLDRLTELAVTER
ncbi:amino acid ABC transporter permease [Homoserinibacter sp. GY 40078]|uniref:amino acid ABC transporter permease n=1 Tax=Homoserinibacter sp. GY 40078 TaxID=2603275 RepID=UPI0011C81583|nr:amino acid ABC transporter permease [Homoserinibacter sp. GY 40078]